MLTFVLIQVSSEIRFDFLCLFLKEIIRLQLIGEELNQRNRTASLAFEDGCYQFTDIFR